MSTPDPTTTCVIAAAILAASYAIGSIPWAYLIVKWVAHEDITAHGTGNVGAMNVKRTTGSWVWFTVAMVADASKGFFPVLAARFVVATFAPVSLVAPWGPQMPDLVGAGGALAVAAFLPPLSVAGAVLGHNYSMWLAIKERHFSRTGKGLATGGGAVLAYDWRYFLVIVIVGLMTIAITKYMMAGQVSAAASLPLGAIVMGSPDWPFALFMGLLVYAAHHKRFVGMLHGNEPKLYTGDRMGPRG